MSSDIILENLVANNVSYAEMSTKVVTFNIFDSGVHKSDGEMVEMLYKKFIPLNFTSIDNGEMVSDLCLMADTAYLDHKHGDVLYLYMLAKRNGDLDDMGLVNSSSLARAITNLDKYYDGQLRVLLADTTSNDKLAAFYRTAHYQDESDVYTFGKAYSKDYEGGVFGFTFNAKCRSKNTKGSSVSTNDLKGFLKCMIDNIFS